MLALDQMATLKENIEITLRISEWAKNPSMYQLEIYDNLYRPKDVVVYKDDKPIRTGMAYIVEERNKAFDKSILDENNNLRPSGLGTIEMDVCAAYLRCIPLLDVDDDRYAYYDNDGIPKKERNVKDPLLIHAYLEIDTENESKASLGYRLYLNKPKEVLVIDDDDTFCIEGNERDKLIDYGILCIASTEFYTSKENYNHQILYLHNTEISKDDILKNNELYSRMPKRIINKIENAIFESEKDFFKQVWQNNVLNSVFKDKNQITLNLAKHNYTIKNDFSEFTPIEGDYNYDIFIDDHWYNYNIELMYKKYYETTTNIQKIKKFQDDHFLNLNKPPLDKKNIKWRLICEYLESFNSKYIVIDERIQQNIVINKNNVSDDLSLVDYFTQQKLLIPKLKQVNLNTPDFTAESDNVSDNLKNFIDENKDCDFIVIHLGVLEKLVSSESKEKNWQAIDSVLKTVLSSIDRNKIIITSGRGTPQNIPKDISFIPLSSVQSALETYKDKLLLTKLIYNSRVNLNKI